MAKTGQWEHRIEYKVNGETKTKVVYKDRPLTDGEVTDLLIKICPPGKVLQYIKCQTVVLE